MTQATCMLKNISLFAEIFCLKFEVGTYRFLYEDGRHIIMTLEDSTFGVFKDELINKEGETSTAQFLHNLYGAITNHHICKCNERLHRKLKNELSKGILISMLEKEKLA